MSDSVTALSRRRSVAVFAAVLACAACGMVYELALIALGSYLLGNAIVQASVVLAVMVFAMGIGALASKRLVPHAALAFAVIELLLGLVGGLSVVALYAAFAWAKAYTSPLVILAFVIGALIGAEIPLLLELLGRLRRRRATDEVANMFAADYVGGLVGGLAFPFVLLPALGLLEGTLLVGALNALIGAAVVLWVFRDDLARRTRRLIAAGVAVVLVVLSTAWWFADDFEVTARQRLYAAPIVLAERTPYQEIVLTKQRDDVRLFLNGNLQVSTSDEHRYHELLVHPAMSGGAHARVLVLGGGDGMAVREILKHPGVREVVLVDLDPAMTRLARTEPHLLAANRGALDDPRVRLVADDAFSWLRDHGAERFDVVVQDLPDPDGEATAKLYSHEMFGMVGRLLSPGGRVVVQSGSPFFAGDAYWCIGRTLTDAGFAVTPYHGDVPSFGDWGFFVGVRGEQARPDAGGGPAVGVAPGVTGLRYLTPPVAAGATAFAPDVAWREVEPSTLLKPVVIEYHRRGWRTY
ncbi:polyamine aminopropyltransferase [Mariniluteicoccus flavus]